jgi:hypothetical protein
MDAEDFHPTDGSPQIKPNSFSTASHRPPPLPPDVASARGRGARCGGRDQPTPPEILKEVMTLAGGRATMWSSTRALPDLPELDAGTEENGEGVERAAPVMEQGEGGGLAE